MMRRPSRLRVLAGGIVVANLLVACSDREGGDPSAPSSAPPSVASSQSVAPSASAGSGAPKVAAPMDPAPFLSRPCDLLSKSKLAAMGYTKPGKPDVDSDVAKDLTGPSCSWFGDGADFSLSIHTVNQRNGNGGLGPIYSGKSNGLYGYLDPVSVPGHSDYPAVSADANDERTEGDCPVFVGIRDDLVFVVHVNYDKEPQKGCTAAAELAAGVIDTLKGAS